MNKKTIGTISIVAALIAILAMPVFAEAGLVGRNNRGAGVAALAGMRTLKGMRTRQPGSAVATGQPAARLQTRIENKLAARKAHFDAVTANLTKRINRVDALASKVASAGGDVTAVRAKLDEARAHLANALALEQETIAKFNAVLTATDRFAAVTEARAQGRKAVEELKQTRFAIRDAAQLLRSVVEDLKAQSAAGTVNAQ